MQVNDAALAALKAEGSKTELKTFLEAQSTRDGYLNTFDQLHVVLVPVLVCRHTYRRLDRPNEPATTLICSYALKEDGTINRDSLYDNVDNAVEKTLTDTCDDCCDQFFKEELIYGPGPKPLCRSCHKDAYGDHAPNPAGS